MTKSGHSAQESDLTAASKRRTAAAENVQDSESADEGGEDSDIHVEVESDQIFVQILPEI